MLTELQQQELHELLQKHAPLNLWNGSFSFFRTSPTPSTMSFIFDNFNRPEVYQKVKELTGLPLHQNKHDLFVTVLDHLYINLNAEKELLYDAAPVTIAIYGEKMKPAINLKWNLFTFFHALGISANLMNWVLDLCLSGKLNKISDQVDKEINLSTQKILQSTDIKIVSAELDKVMMNFVILTVLYLIIEQNIHSFIAEKYLYHWDDIEKHYIDMFGAKNLTYQSQKDLLAVTQNKMTTDAYLAKFGTMGVVDFELSEPRFIEDPSRLKVVIAQLQKEIATEKKQYPLPPMSWFERKLAEKYWESQAIIGTARVKSTVIIAHLRNLLLQFAKLNNLPGNTVFFMRKDELFNNPQSFLENAQQREISYLQNTKLRLPQLVTEETITNMLLPYTKGGTYKVIPVSAGVVTAKLKCVKKPEDAQCDDRNCVMVFPDGAPVYTKYYKHGVGIIFERGGSTTHGAILAREYKMPAISLGGQTFKLEDGLVVTIDGEKGTLQIQ